MNFLRIATRIFAVFSLLFVNFISINSQTKSLQSVYDLQAGTKIRLSMDNEINSKVASVNDTFTATLSEPLVVREVTVLPVGSVIEGKIVKVKSASVGGKNGELAVSFETIRFADGTKRQIQGVLVKNLKVDSSKELKILTIVGATALGGVIGAVSKTQGGALVGAGIGAGAGTGIVFLQKGKDVRIKADEKFEIELIKSVSLPARDY